MLLCCFFLMWLKVKLKATMTTNNRRLRQHDQMTRKRRGRGTKGRKGIRGGEQQRQTWLSVSPFIHQHLKRCTKQLGSVCWDCPFIPLTAVVYKNTKSPVVCVCWFLRTPERPGSAGWRGGVNFYTLQKHILFSCCQWNKNVFSTGSLVLVMVKKLKKNQESETKKKKK